MNWLGQHASKTAFSLRQRIGVQRWQMFAREFHNKGDTMNKADWNRAKDKAETWAEWILIQVVGFPKPFTAVVTIILLILAGMGAFFIWSAL